MSFTYTKIQEAKALLKEAGYFTDNLKNSRSKGSAERSRLFYRQSMAHR